MLLNRLSVEVAWLEFYPRYLPVSLIDVGGLVALLSSVVYQDLLVFSSGGFASFVFAFSVYAFMDHNMSVYVEAWGSVLGYEISVVYGV